MRREAPSTPRKTLPEEVLSSQCRERTPRRRFRTIGGTKEERGSIFFGDSNLTRNLFSPRGSGARTPNSLRSRLRSIDMNCDFNGERLMPLRRESRLSEGFQMLSELKNEDWKSCKEISPKQHNAADFIKGIKTSNNTDVNGNNSGGNLHRDSPSNREGTLMHEALFRKEILGASVSTDVFEPEEEVQGDLVPCTPRNQRTDASRRLKADKQRENKQSSHTRLLHFSSSKYTKRYSFEDSIGPGERVNDFSNFSMAYSQLQKAGGRRKISRTPYKVLDAPSIEDDFYLNLVDWSSKNILAVGLGSSVYLWSARTSKVDLLCDLSDSKLLRLEEENLLRAGRHNVIGGTKNVTSVCWSLDGRFLAIGSSSGLVQLWDSESKKLVRFLQGHEKRASALSFSNSLLASGSRDRTIMHHDMKARDSTVSRVTAHEQEVCGLKWSFDGTQLASGGNDNKLAIWSVGRKTPLFRIEAHKAAVKAIAWSPHQTGLLATGGGTADRCIRFWNSHTGAEVNCIDTGSQVCNLMWSKNVNELVSTHGYSLNQIIVWKYPNMAKVTTLTGHTMRVLYLAMSPDGQNIVTGAGDETLRLWNLFPPSSSKEAPVQGSVLLANGMELR